MSQLLRITVLVENSVNVGGLTAEHGLAYFIEIGGRRLLFDTGQMDALAHNAAKLNLPLDQLDAIILSHGHFDHSGNLAQVLQKSPRARLFLHPGALEEKFTFDNRMGKVRSIGMPAECVQAARARAPILTNSFTEICPGCYLTGSVPRNTSFENAESNLFANCECTRTDPVMDDQSLFFNCRDGLVVLLGCAHAGVVNTLAHIHDFTGGKRIQALIGGMHLINASPERIQETIETLRQLGVEGIVPLHCTGWEATLALWQALPGRCLKGYTGARFEFPL